MTRTVPLDARDGQQLSSPYESRSRHRSPLPRWMDSVGAMLRMKVLVRARCSQCGTLLRIELEDVVARHGPGYSLVDRLDRCRMVGCIGAAFYLVSRTYGREWTALLRDPGLLASFATLPPARTALG